LYSQVQLPGLQPTFSKAPTSYATSERAISAEAGARPTYETLIKPTSTKAPQQTSCHLLTREIITEHAHESARRHAHFG